MNVSKLKLNRVTQCQEVILFMKNMGLIKDKVRQWQFNNNTEKIDFG